MTNIKICEIKKHFNLITFKYNLMNHFMNMKKNYFMKNYFMKNYFMKINHSMKIKENRSMKIKKNRLLKKKNFSFQSNFLKFVESNKFSIKISRINDDLMRKSSHVV
jgi:hypothetical protein